MMSTKLHHHHQGNGRFFVHEGEGDDHAHMAYDNPIDPTCGGCELSLAFAVAALIAEGGEIMEAKARSGPGPEAILPAKSVEPGRYLVYGPIPVESAEAKET